MAYRLAKAFGSTPESWLNLQTIYDLAQVRAKAEALEVRQFFAPQPVAP
jgi:plasmid maintenance system antidote protein VapI